MKTKVTGTLVWAAVLVGVNRLVSITDWAQHAATFLLCGAYALLIDKVGGPRTRNGRRY